MARPRKFTVKGFQHDVEKYFRSRTTIRATGDKDLDGEEIFYADFAIPPSISDLCRELNISRDTFAEYSRTPGFSEACEWAKLQIEAWLERQLNKRDKVEGIKFNLSCNYGWAPAERREVELGGKTREVLSAATVPMEEKLALISSVLGDMRAEADGHGAGRDGHDPGDLADGDADGVSGADGLGGVGYYDDEDSTHGAVDYSDRPDGDAGGK